MTGENMEASLMRVVGQIAGIGGISLGVFLLLFRDIIRINIFPQLTKKQAFKLLLLISILVWSMALAGIGAWLWASNSSGTPGISQKVGNSGTAVIHTGTGDINVEKTAPK